MLLKGYVILVKKGDIIVDIPPIKMINLWERVAGGHTNLHNSQVKCGLFTIPCLTIKIPNLTMIIQFQIDLN